MGGAGSSAVFNSWLGQLSCALQKANVACLRSAGAASRGPVPGVHAEAAEASGPGFSGEGDDWLDEAVEELLQWAAANPIAEAF